MLICDINRHNVEGKPVEQLVYLAGMDEYDRVTTRVLKEGDAEWEGFDVIKSQQSYTRPVLCEEHSREEENIEAVKSM
jgi:hypothetical protein